MRLGFITLALASAMATAAPAQQNNPLAADAARSQQEFLNGINFPGVGMVPTDDWSKCASNGDIPCEHAIHSCGRIIGERISRTDTAAAYFYRAHHYGANGDAERAQADYQRSLQLLTEIIPSEHERSPDPYRNRAAVLLRLGRYDEALADTAAAISIAERRRADASGDDAEYWTRALAEQHAARASAYFQMRDFDAATREFDAAASLDQSQDSYHASRCISRAAAGADGETARTACDEANRLDADNAYARFARGFLLFRQGDFHGAYADFAAAVAVDGNAVGALYGRGVAALRIGRADGQADIDRAIARNRETVETYANAGLRP